MMQTEDIDNRFSFHPVKSEADKVAHEQIREKLREIAHFVNVMVPEGREKSLAITHLEEAMMWANAGIARARPRE